MVSGAFRLSVVPAKLPQTLRADIFSAEHRHVLDTVAEDAAGPIFLENDR